MGDRKHQGFIIIAIWGRGVREGTAGKEVRGQNSGQGKQNSHLTQGGKGRGKGFRVRGSGWDRKQPEQPFGGGTPPLPSKNRTAMNSLCARRAQLQSGIVFSFAAFALEGFGFFLNPEVSFFFNGGWGWGYGEKSVFVF